MFYTYVQNNSGGSFIESASAGISHYVIVEAESPGVADARAAVIGLYFDGAGDCECCGERWSDKSYSWGGDEGTSEPEVYGRVVKDGKLEKDKYSIKWMRGPEGYIHYADGRVVPIDY